MHDISDRLKEVRANLSLSQAAFSEKIKVGVSTVAAWEIGSRKIKDIHILQICQTFGVDENWLRSGEGQMYRMLNTDNNLAIEVGKLLSSKDEWTKNAVVQFLKLSPEQRETIKNFILQLNPK